MQDFTYIGSIISSKYSPDQEISNRISRASAVFGQLTGRVYFNENLYQTIVISNLLYDSES